VRKFLVDVAEDYKSLPDFCNLVRQQMIRSYVRNWKRSLHLWCKPLT